MAHCRVDLLPKRRMSNHHDTDYKELFSYPELVRQIIEGFAPPEVAAKEGDGHSCPAVRLLTMRYLGITLKEVHALANEFCL
jgi:hypothetical protein